MLSDVVTVMTRRHSGRPKGDPESTLDSGLPLRRPQNDA